MSWALLVAVLVAACVGYVVAAVVMTGRGAVAPLAPPAAADDERQIKIDAAKARAAAATDVHHAHEVLTHDQKIARLQRDFLGRK